MRLVRRVGLNLGRTEDILSERDFLGAHRRGIQGGNARGVADYRLGCGAEFGRGGVVTLGVPDGAIFFVLVSS